MIRSGRNLPRWGGFGLWLGLLGVATSCTLALESKLDKCKADSDCVRLGPAFENSVCDVDRGLCVQTQTNANKPVAGCTSNAQCLAESSGQPAICRKSDQQCVPVLSDDCVQVQADASDLADDNVILVGTILARNGVTSAAAKAIEDAMDLARRDFKTATPGLPPATVGGKQRPLVLVNCDETADPVRAANHLVDLGVPAIIGAYYSSSTIKIASTVTIPQGVLLVSPASNSPLITSLSTSSPRLVWRTVPSDLIQASVVPQVVSTVLEPDIRKELGNDRPVKVAIVHRGDAAGVGISQGIIPKLKFNNKTAVSNGDNFIEVDYGDPLDKANNPDPTIKYAEAAAKLLAFQPQIAIAVGVTSEVVNSIFTPLEQQWVLASYRPRYLLANNTLQSQDTLNFIGSNANLRHRVLGHIAGASGQAIDALHFRFNSTYQSSYTGLVPFAYDSVYLVALGIVANGPNPLTGSNLATSLSKLLPPGPTVNVGVDEISSAYGFLTHGNSIDLNGVSGPMDYNPSTGDAESDVQIWCAGVDSTTGAAKGYQNSGLYYNAKAGALQGSISCP